MASRVFIVQEVPGRNLLPVKQFGEPVVLLPANEQIMFSSERVTSRLWEALRTFGDNDFILATGDPAAIGLACDIASQVNKHCYKMLKWDRQERIYYVVYLNTAKQ